MRQSSKHARIHPRKLYYQEQMKFGNLCKTIHSGTCVIVRILAPQKQQIIVKSGMEDSGKIATVTG